MFVHLCQMNTSTCQPHLTISPCLFQGDKVLAKYVALYAADLIKKNAVLPALKLFASYGAPANPQNFNIYKALCQMVFNGEGGVSNEYKMYAYLRNILLQVVREEIV